MRKNSQTDIHANGGKNRTPATAFGVCNEKKAYVVMMHARTMVTNLPQLNIGDLHGYELSPSK